MAYFLTKSIKSLLLVAGVLLVAGCSKNEGGEGGFRVNNYVRYYMNPTNLFLVLRTTDAGNPADTVLNAQTEYSSAGFHILSGGSPLGKTWHNGKFYSPDDVEKYRFGHYIRKTPISTDDELYNPEFNRLYDSLSVAHKDTEYDKKSISTQQILIPVLYRGIKVNVMSDTPYDASHPAGSPLNDIVNIEFCSVLEILEGGYDFANCPSPENGRVIEQTLTRFNDGYRKLIGCNFKLRLTKAPDATAVHRFTVTYTDEDGRTLTSVTSPVKIKGGN